MPRIPKLKFSIPPSYSTRFSQRICNGKNEQSIALNPESNIVHADVTLSTVEEENVSRAYNPKHGIDDNAHVNLPTVKNILFHLKNYNKENDAKFDSNLAIGSLPHTIQHEAKINLVLEDFHFCLMKYSKGKWKEALTIVKCDGPGTIKLAPRILNDVAGEKTLEKTQMGNLALVDWMTITCKKVYKPQKKRTREREKN